MSLLPTQQQRQQASWTVKDNPAIARESHNRNNNNAINREFVSATTRGALHDECEERSQSLNNELLEDLYSEKFPLVKTMLLGESTRKKAFQTEGRKQIGYVKSTSGWLPTVMAVEGRALDHILGPFFFVMVNAIVWTTLAKRFKLYDSFDDSISTWEFGYVTLALSFLLVFRLNRAAERWWLSREMWGRIVGVGRNLAGNICVHGNHAPQHRDRAIAWVAAFGVAVMYYLQSDGDTDGTKKGMDPDQLSGILSRQEVHLLGSAHHPPLCAGTQIRLALADIFTVTADTPLSLAHAWTVQLNLMEEQVNHLLLEVGGLERIKSTPLPITYVSHLRTFMLLFLLLLPYAWVGMWGWFTIPAVAVVSFGMLGIEGISQEVEVPFDKSRVNHLLMDTYCLTLLDGIQYIIKGYADRCFHLSMTLERVEDSKKNPE